VTGGSAPGGAGPPAPDRHVIEGYLSGREAEFREVEGWILREIDARYPSLAGEREDLCQQVHEKLLASLRAGRFRHGSSLRTYVTSVVHHTCIDGLRRRYLHRIDELPADLPAGWGNPYRALEALDGGRILHRVLQLSPEICRRLWRLIFLDGLRYEEIGRRLGIPSGTVKSRVFGCRQRALAIFKRLQRATAR
jgi:RNA polymerase sigma factor (sigma-70 family)